MCRKLIYLISFVLVMGLAVNAGADLVAHWSLDDGSGTTATDMSGNGHDGTIGGTVNFVPGKSGSAHGCWPTGEPTFPWARNRT